MHKLIRILGFSACLSTITACAGMADSVDTLVGVGQISVTQEALDDSTSVKLAAAWLTDDVKDHGLNSYKLGGRWNSQAPGTVFLEIKYESQVGGNAYVSFSGLTIRIDGESQNFDSLGTTDFSSGAYNDLTNTIYTESSGIVPVPLEIVEKMVSASDVRLRLNSSDGYEDSIFSFDRTPSGQKLARPYFQDFLVEIEKHRHDK